MVIVCIIACKIFPTDSLDEVIQFLTKMCLGESYIDRSCITLLDLTERAQTVTHLFVDVSMKTCL